MAIHLTTRMRVVTYKTKGHHPFAFPFDGKVYFQQAKMIEPRQSTTLRLKLLLKAKKLAQ